MSIYLEYNVFNNRKIYMVYNRVNKRGKKCDNSG